MGQLERFMKKKDSFGKICAFIKDRLWIDYGCVTLGRSGSG